jgi:signal transduction histidine kinase
MLLILLAFLPLVALVWLGWHVARGETLRVQQQYRLLMEERLAEENRKLQRFFAELQRTLGGLVRQRGTSPEALRQLVRENPKIRQAIVLSREGDLVHPRPDAPMNASEREFLAEIQQILADKDLTRRAFPQARGAAANVAQSAVSSSPDEGWYTWYYGRGVHLLYWQRTSDDTLTVLALSRARWTADLLAVLPETQPPSADSPLDAARQRISLVDASNQLVYEWGSLLERPGDTPVAEAVVSEPLAAWRLRYYLDPSHLRPVSRLPIIAGLAALACGLLGLTVVLYRDYSRDIREAAQRVNFVNQVSHELKTPLTNIRLYADLLERDLEQLPPDRAAKPRQRLDVILAESQRLTRLITNVLLFARSERSQLQARTQMVDLDQLVRDLLERLRPLLDESQITVELNTQLARPIAVDPDFIEQILGNLITNVQRYAAEGGGLVVSTFRDQDWAVVEISDRGPGIDAELAARLFEPFARGASGLSDTAGTGIGLSIARRLARLQGGDLTLLPGCPGNSGARFRLSLPLTANA